MLSTYNIEDLALRKLEIMKKIFLTSALAIAVAFVVALSYRYGYDFSDGEII